MFAHAHSLWSVYKKVQYPGAQVSVESYVKFHGQFDGGMVLKVEL